MIEEFEKRFGMLSDVHLATQLKISQITGLRDGVRNALSDKAWAMLTIDRFLP